MNKPVTNIVIVGGGTAGWLTCAIIAAEHCAKSKQGMTVTLIELPDAPTIGIGEGTWPSIRETLCKVGIRETDLVRECDASFKQGSKFSKWLTGKFDDAFYHPLATPQGYSEINLVPFWQPHADKVSFADAVSSQGQLCELGLAPKQKTTPEFEHVANYAYHFNETKFATFLRKHCVNSLGVKHIADQVDRINSSANGDIESITTAQHGEVEGDLFIDCSGNESLLLGQHCGIEQINCKHILFNDSILACQLPYDDEATPIASHTISTAQSAGWIWDIGMSSSRCVGHVFSSKHIDCDNAERALRQYVTESSADFANRLEVQKISINQGYRQKFWHNNCVAIGLSAGCLEPLETPFLLLVEKSASMISEQMPANRETMDFIANRYNERCLNYWQSTIEFLKLHYVLSKRTDSDYWIENRRESSVPDKLTSLLAFWKYHPPWQQDFANADVVFPSASYQYVLCGMGFETKAITTKRQSMNERLAQQYFQKNHQLSQKFTSSLPTNRELLRVIKQSGLRDV